MTRTTLCHALASLVVMLVALTGCSGDPEPRMADPSATPQSSDASAGLADKPPAIPAAAEAMTKVGAIAFAEFYWDVVNYAQQALDPSVLDDYVTDTCRACNGGADFIRRVASRDGTIRGGDVSVSNEVASPFEGSQARGFAVDLTLTTTRQVVTYAGNQETDRYPAGSNPGKMLIEASPDGWRVAFWDV